MYLIYNINLYYSRLSAVFQLPTYQMITHVKAKKHTRKHSNAERREVGHPLPRCR